LFYIGLYWGVNPELHAWRRSTTWVHLSPLKSVLLVFWITFPSLKNMPTALWQEFNKLRYSRH
jgi:hypothetical protein